MHLSCVYLGKKWVNAFGFLEGILLNLMNRSCQKELLIVSTQVFKSTSGEKLTEIQAHDDEVLCCAFSPDDRLLATCSSDRKVKVSIFLL